MFIHTHPFKPFIPKGTTKLVVGTLPPPRFTTGDLLPGDVNFCYGSRDGQLWPILDRIFNLGLKFETTKDAIEQRKDFLRQHGIGICDIVASARREKIDATDLGMRDIQLRNMVCYLTRHPHIKTVLFTGGNSKNGPEYLFRLHLKEHGLKLTVVNAQVPRIHQLTVAGRMLQTVSLTAPSGSANRAVGSMERYKELKAANPRFNTLEFRILQYKDFF